MGGCEAGAEVIGFEATNTVIWLGEMVLEEAGICMTEWTLVTVLGLGLGLVAEPIGFTAELEFKLLLTVDAELI